MSLNDDAPVDATGASKEQPGSDSDADGTAERGERGGLPNGEAESVEPDSELADAYEVVGRLLLALQRDRKLLASGSLNRETMGALATVTSCDATYTDHFWQRAFNAGVPVRDLLKLIDAVDRFGQGRRLRLLPGAEILTREDPQFLIDTLIEDKGLCELFGPSESGKTFVALDWAFCIAAGIPWLGLATMAGPVVYVAAEGAGGLKKRLRALMAHHGLDALPPDLYFIDQAVNLMEPASIEEAIEAVEELNVAPRLVVFDTYARCMVGGDENSAKDTGAAVASLDRFRFALDTTVAVVHHTGKSLKEQRGSYALHCAVDSVLRLDAAEGHQLTLVTAKQKNFDHAPRVLLQLVPVEQSLVPGARTETSEGTDGNGSWQSFAPVRPNDDERIADEIVAVLRDAMKAGGKMWRSQTELLNKVRGNARRKAAVLHALVDDTASEVSREQVGKTYRYFIL